MKGLWKNRAVGLRSAACLGMMLQAVPVEAALDPAELCDRAAARASAETGVPLDVLRTVALVESGRPNGGDQRPWPWTANFGGQGYWYATSREAELAVDERRSMGATNIDIGCFQINHRWHGANFASVSAMFDPDANALYAAQFLSRLFDETGNWPDAAAAYHSRTPEHAEVYRARFEAVAGGQNTSSERAPRLNRFPLLQSGASGSLGSLVPHVAGTGSLFGTTP
jgi:hypothetical protein